VERIVFLIISITQVGPYCVQKRKVIQQQGTTKIKGKMCFGHWKNCLFSYFGPQIPKNV
jgi:hypothetical protein